MSKMGTSSKNLVSEVGNGYGAGTKLPQYIAAICVCLGSMATGTVLGWTSNIGEKMKVEGFNNIPINDDVLGWIGSCMTLGAMVMCFPIGILCDLLGRKLAMLLLIIPFMTGWLILIFGETEALIYLGRFITGMAGGAFCVSAPLYTSEIAEKEIRGALGSYFQLMLTIGILFSYVIGYTVEDTKLYTIICAVLPLIFGVVFFFQPETPVFRLKQGRDNDAREILVRLRGNNYDVDAEIRDIKQDMEDDAHNNVSLGESLKKRGTKKAALVCFGLMFFQQASGVNAVIFYTGTIFESAGLELDSRVATIMVGVMQVVATFVSSLVVDKLGRRILLLSSDFLMAVAGILLGLFFSIKDRELADENAVQSLGFLPVLSLCVFIVVFSLGFGPIPWMISSELFPREIKSLASSLAGTFNWFIAFLITKFYLNLKNEVGGDITFYIFAAISLVGTVFIFFVVPETKGKTLDEIQRELNGESNSRRGFDNEAYAK